MTYQLPPFKEGHEPTHRINEIAWVILNQRVQQVRIFGINYTEVEDGRHKRHVLITTGYDTDAYSNFATGDRSFLPWQIISDQAEAERLAVWHPVIGLTEEQWLTVTEDVLEEAELPDNCELSSCFDGIEPAQGLFIQCQADGGLIQRDVERLAHVIERNGRSSSPGPNLKNIMDQLGLTWPAETQQ